MKTIRGAAFLLVAGLGLLTQRLMAQQETEIPGVTASLVELRASDGVLRLAIAFKNNGDKPATSSKALEFSKVVLVDGQSKQKHFAVKDPDGHYLAGPISDWNGGGRWYARIPPGGQALVWVLFESMPAGSRMSVQVPLMFPFDDVAVTEGAPKTELQVAGSVLPLTARLVSAKRSEGQLKIQLKISNSGKTVPSGPAIRYADVFAFDPQSMQKYPLLKDTEGIFQAQPISDKNDGGRWFASYVRPGTDALMNLIFTAPPDPVRQVDIMIPDFVPLEAVSITGTGGGAAPGIGVAGKSLGLESALKELNAEVSAQEIKIDLAADVLFDFDKASIKPEAEPSLEKVATVLKAYPAAQVDIDGYTDGKGNAEYNQTLSEKRASVVGQWLMGRSSLPAGSFRTTGWGMKKPVAPNTNPDGTDNPEGRKQNRRVEIVIRPVATSVPSAIASPSARESVDYPLALNTAWTYHYHMEVGEGVHFGTGLGKLAKGNTADVTVVSQVVGTDLIGALKYTRIESRMNGLPWLTEWDRLAPEGFMIGKTIDAEAGQTIVMIPPQKTLSPSLKTGESWDWNPPGAPVSMHYSVVGTEKVTVPAGTFDAIHVLVVMNISTQGGMVVTRQSRWFVAALGYVKQDTESRLGGRLLTRGVLTLEKYEPGT